MSTLTQNTDLQLPTQSHYGTIVKTPAFKDPQTLETTWLIAHRGIAGNWTVREFTTEILGGDNPTIDSKIYKDNSALRYGDAIRVLADYERVRKNSGMLDLVNDYPTTKNIPSYRDIAHLDGIAFDRDGYAHPTVQGNIVTDGKFEANEMMTVLEAVHNPMTSGETPLAKLSRIFSTHCQPQQIIANSQHSTMLTDTINFITAMFERMEFIRQTNNLALFIDTSDEKQVWPGYKKGHAEFGYKYPYSSMRMRISKGEDSYSLDYENKRRDFRVLSHKISTDPYLDNTVKENICGFLHALHLMSHAQLIYSYTLDPVKIYLCGSTKSAVSELQFKKRNIESVCRYFMIEELVYHSNGKMLKDEVNERIVALEAMAKSSDFPKKLQEIYEAGELVIEGVKKLIPQQSSVPQVATGGTALPAPKVV